jgi:hypothetical protein
MICYGVFFRMLAYFDRQKRNILASFQTNMVHEQNSSKIPRRIVSSGRVISHVLLTVTRIADTGTTKVAFLDSHVGR